MRQIDRVGYASAYAWSGDDLARIGLQGHVDHQDRGIGRDGENLRVLFPEEHQARGGWVHFDDIRHRVNAPLGHEDDSCPEGRVVGCDLHHGGHLGLSHEVPPWSGHHAPVESVRVRALGGFRHENPFQADGVPVDPGALPVLLLGPHDLHDDFPGLEHARRVPRVWETNVVLRRHAQSLQEGFVGILEPGVNRKG